MISGWHQLGCQAGLDASIAAWTSSCCNAHRSLYHRPCDTLQLNQAGCCQLAARSSTHQSFSYRPLLATFHLNESELGHPFEHKLNADSKASSWAQHIALSAAVFGQVPAVEAWAFTSKGCKWSSSRELTSNAAAWTVSFPSCREGAGGLASS